MTTHVTDVTHSDAQNSTVHGDFPELEYKELSDSPSQALTLYQEPVSPIVFDANMSEDEKIEKLQQYFSYTGVVPVPFPVNKPRLIAGCIYQKVEVPRQINRDTGEIEKEAYSFEQVLFKSADMTNEDGDAIIYQTGSRDGLRFGHTMIQVCGIGDWNTPRTVRCNQQELKNNKRMYRWQMVKGE